MSHGVFQHTQRPLNGTLFIQEVVESTGCFLSVHQLHLIQVELIIDRPAPRTLGECHTGLYTSFNSVDLAPMVTAQCAFEIMNNA